MFSISRPFFTIFMSVFVDDKQEHLGGGDSGLYESWFTIEEVLMVTQTQHNGC